MQRHDRLAFTTDPEFDGLIGRLADCDSPEDHKRVEEALWDRFGTEGTVMITDLAAFSHSSRHFGIAHFLKLIQRARALIAPAIADHGGNLVKCEADNCYSFFRESSDALRASAEVHAAFERANAASHQDDHTSVAIGIDCGPLLLVGDHEFFGDPVNTASKLGEDLAGGNETLVSQRTVAASDFSGLQQTPVVTRISQIEIEYYRLPGGRLTE